MSEYYISLSLEKEKQMCALFPFAKQTFVIFHGIEYKRVDFCRDDDGTTSFDLQRNMKYAQAYAGRFSISEIR